MGDVVSITDGVLAPSDPVDPLLDSAYEHLRRARFSVFGPKTRAEAEEALRELSEYLRKGQS